jgi:spore coat-associated protein N
MQQVIRRPKRTLAALGVALAATAVAIGTGADFSAQSTNPSNVFSAGTLTMSDSAAGAAVFSPANMKPGAPDQTGVVDIENTGSLAGGVSLSRDSVAVTDAGVAEDGGAMDRKIDLTVSDCGLFAAGSAPDCAKGSVVYQGTLADMPSTALGTFAAGDRHRYLFAAHLDGSADNTYQGDSVSARFVWDAVQTP